MKTILTVILGFSVLYAAWVIQPEFIGEPPKTKYSAASHAGLASEYSDPDIERLKNYTKTKPEDKKAWQALSEGLIRKIEQGIIPREQASIDAIYALGKQLELDESDPQPILKMADLSFELRAFGKAKELYEKYLTKSPEDLAASTRYASALTFLGEGQKAEDILKNVISKNPEDFQAAAFLALAYSQLGKDDLVKEWGDKAISLAPHQEARDRLNTFLAGYLNKKDTTEISGLKSYLTNHPIVGAKLKEYSENNGIVNLLVSDFPMNQMPQFAREKFEQGIADTVKSSGEKINKVIFLDAETKQELGVINLQ